jgi:hypothetical protein
LNRSSVNLTAVRVKEKHTDFLSKTWDKFSEVFRKKLD